MLGCQHKLMTPTDNRHGYGDPAKCNEGKGKGKCNVNLYSSSSQTPLMHLDVN